MSHRTDSWISAAMNPAQDAAVKWLEAQANEYRAVMDRIENKNSHPYAALNVELASINEAITSIGSHGLYLYFREEA